MECKEIIEEEGLPMDVDPDADALVCNISLYFLLLYRAS
jgi:pyrrolidone-carboxylate peptidase